MLKSQWLRCLRVVSVKQPVKPWQILRKLNPTGQVWKQDVENSPVKQILLLPWEE